MPRPYQPPIPNHERQAVQTAGPSRGRRRAMPRWLPLALLGLGLPFVAVVLASSLPLLTTGRGSRPEAASSGATSAVTGVPLATSSAAGAAVASTATPVPATAGNAPPATVAATATATASSASTVAAPASGTTTTSGTTAATSTTAAGTTTNPSTTHNNPQAATSTAVAAAQGSQLYHAHRVEPGETVRFLAETYGVSVASIAQASGLRNADRLQVGQVLTIPSQPGWLIRVQPGETLEQIAARSGVASSIIADASNLSSDVVHTGDVLLIPDRSSTLARSK